ncbi:apoptosis-associated speck-like protein containing a CARD isoform X2 [Sebastes fasciatus]|uniref:apoptosis-associated speck-like protein containing a CARD isoform X2 n=1 Tax=Sebastes fasciatus TaxID=394691 RepID=UPI003D9F849E
MPPKTIKKALTDMLADLSKENFDSFRHQLVDRREEPTVRRNRVEGKSFLEIADVLVTTFTEAKAPEVAAQLLREIGCSDDADKLVKATCGQSSQPGPGDSAGPSAGAAAVTTMAEGKHFVDKHRSQLIDRVSDVAPILDQLLDENVIRQGCYDEILAIPTTRDKMRKLYSGPLNAAGPAGKDVFYKILEKYEPYLIAELKKKK